MVLTCSRPNQQFRQSDILLKSVTQIVKNYVNLNQKHIQPTKQFRKNDGRISKIYFYSIDNTIKLLNII